MSKTKIASIAPRTAHFFEKVALNRLERKIASAGAGDLHTGGLAYRHFSQRQKVASAVRRAALSRR